MPLKIKNLIGQKEINHLKKRLNEVLNSENGVIILMNDNKITDFFQGFCA